MGKSMMFRVVPGLLAMILVCMLAGDLQAQRSTSHTLPVMFDSVRISMKNGAILVEWTNLTERELLEYKVERSPDARNFSTVARVKPRSNLNDPESYDAMDPAPLNGLSYYRIRVNEQTGKIIYSLVLKIETGNPETGLTVYPNPCTNGQLGWSVANLPAGNYNMTITGMHGAVVYSCQQRIQGKAFTSSIELPAGIVAGVYRLSLQGDGIALGKTILLR